MPSKSSRTSKPKSAEAPPVTTNFRQIKGITQLSEARLHRAGIKTFDELASLQPEEILAALGHPKGITVKQIIEQDWIGQARKLSGKKTINNGSIESEGFIVNLFLSRTKQVHSTQVLHVNSDVGEKWDGWDSQRLLDFITNRAGVELPKAEIAEEKPAPVWQPPATVTEYFPESLPPPIQSPEIVLRPLEMIPKHSDAPSKLLRIGEPFDVHLSIDAGRVPPQYATSLDFTAALIARGLDTSQPIHLGEIQGALSSPDETIVVNIPRQNFKPGTYRLEAALTISKQSQTIGKPAFARTIFQVF